MRNWDAIVFWVAFVLWFVFIGMIAGGVIK